MSYASLESSVNSGQPIELYKFVKGSETFLYTTYHEDIVYNSETYQPSSLTRDRIKQNTDPFKNDLQITFPRTNVFALSFIVYSPEEVTTLTVFRGHVNDNDYQAYWKGRVLGAEADDNSIKITCESSFTSLRRNGLRAVYEYNCRHSLYSNGCGVNKESFDVSGAVDAIAPNGLSVTISEASSQADGYYNGGFVLIGGVRRFISNHVGGLLEITAPFQSAEVGDTAIIYAGCDHTKATCNSKFNNVINFGGFPYIPAKNPFNESIF